MFQSRHGYRRHWYTTMKIRHWSSQQTLATIGISAVLMHRCPDGSEMPIAYASRVLSDVERQYSTINKQALVIAFAVHNKFQQYTWGTD
jgi:RNase H-like domain found in reverse transcriptase